MGMLEDWLSIMEPPAGRPLVTLSYAQSLDGSIAGKRGAPLALSGEESQKLTHRLRAAHDGILVGIGTMLSDDPQLSVRLAEGKDPRPVVLDGRLRMPLGARLLKGSRPLVFCTAQADTAAEAALQAAGAQVERQADNATRRIELAAMLERLAELGLATVMVEGGGEVIASFLQAGLVDRAVITIAPRFVGGYKALASLVEEGPGLIDVQVDQVGDDLVVWGRVNQA